MTTVMDRPIHRSKWLWLRKLGVVVAIITVGSAAAFALVGGAQRSVRIPTVNVTVEAVTRGVFRDFIPLRGTVVAHDTVYVDAASGGRIERVLVEPGDIVAAGQPLVEFNNTSLQLQVIQQESQLNQAITQLQSNEIALEQNKISNERALAQLDYDIIRLSRSLARRGDLAAKGYTAIEQRDIVLDELDYDKRVRPLQAESNIRQEVIRTGQLPLIEDQLQKLRKNLDIVHGKLDDLIARSPTAGQITDINLNVGENKNQGERLTTITPNTGFKTSADVDEFYLGRIQLGQTGDVELGGNNWKIRVTRIYPQVKNGMFAVDLAFEGNNPSGLLPGQAVQGKLSLGDSAGNVLAAGAFLERTGGDWIFAVAQDGKSAERRRIKLGRRSSEQVEILEGLNPGERVIISDYTGLEKIDRVDLEQ